MDSFNKRGKRVQARVCPRRRRKPGYGSERINGLSQLDYVLGFGRGMAHHERVVSKSGW
jgi:hypothetical protein